jgi:hypothetical protein
MPAIFFILYFIFFSMISYVLHVYTQYALLHYFMCPYDTTVSLDASCVDKEIVKPSHVNFQLSYTDIY